MFPSLPWGEHLICLCIGSGPQRLWDPVMYCFFFPFIDGIRVGHTTLPSGQGGRCPPKVQGGTMAGLMSRTGTGNGHRGTGALAASPPLCWPTHSCALGLWGRETRSATTEVPSLWHREYLVCASPAEWRYVVLFDVVWCCVVSLCYAAKPVPIRSSTSVLMGRNKCFPEIHF